MSSPQQTERLYELIVKMGQKHKLGSPDYKFSSGHLLKPPSLYNNSHLQINRIDMNKLERKKYL
jgi:hypothetical protein